MEVYKEKFFNTLIENIKGLEGKLTTNKEHSLTRTLKNTCLFAQVLQDTFSEMRDVVGMLAMSASCDYSPINKRE